VAEPTGFRIEGRCPTGFRTKKDENHRPYSWEPTVSKHQDRTRSPDCVTSGDPMSKAFVKEPDSEPDLPYEPPALPTGVKNYTTFGGRACRNALETGEARLSSRVDKKRMRGRSRVGGVCRRYSRRSPPDPVFSRPGATEWLSAGRSVIASSSKLGRHRHYAATRRGDAG
jgi:hypothetical protein